MSGRSPDECLCSKMDFVILIVRLTTWKHQDRLLSGQAMLLDHGVVDMTAIHTTPAGRPHLSIGGLNVEELAFYHETSAA